MNPLGQILLRNAVISEEDLDIALTQQMISRRRLGEVLVELKLVQPGEILRALAEQAGVAYVDLDTDPPDPDVLALLQPALARRFTAVPVRRDGDAIIVAMANPRSLLVVDDIKIVLQQRVVPALADINQIEQVIIRMERGDQATVEALHRASEQAAPRYDAATADRPEDAPLVEFINNLFADAINEHASDIHIEPTAGDTRIRLRVDGVLREVMTAPRHLHPMVVSRIKVESGMNIAERRIPQDGRLASTLPNGVPINARIATIPSVHGEAVTVRLITRDIDRATIDGLGLLPEQLSRLRNALASSHGSIVVTGPTGSGKTTTLYAALQELNDPTRNIITIEDPVEYQLEGIKQVQVNPKAGLTFATALRSFLRADPDVILVGEMRDLETAKIAIEAALTGHKLLSSVHTATAASTPTRLVEMGLQPFYVNSALSCVVAQRLARRLCDHCKRQTAASPAQLTAITIPEDLLNSDGSLTIWEPVGCRRCGHSGYNGRFAIYELMFMDDAIRELVALNAPSREIQKMSQKAGMWTLQEDGIRKAATGISSLQEVMRVVL
jgi:type IV pilus assembly protein PilB